jgi:hypothetical protein
MDDLVLNVRQIGSYPQLTPGPADAILFQQGGLGGTYAWTSPGALVAPAIAQQITTATINITGVGPISWAQGQFLQATSSGFSFNWPGTPGLLLSILPTGDATLTGMLSVGRDPANPFEVSTKNYVDNTVATAKQLLTDNSVWTVNGKQGNVNLTWADLIGMGGAPIMSPAFQGTPTAPSITNDNQHDWQIANTAFVQDVVNCKINALLHAQPFVWSFNGRIGNVWLTVDDVNQALAAPGAIAYATTPPLGDASGRIATTLFVDNSIEDLRSWVDQQNFAFDQQLSLYAPLASPNFSGIPQAPTANPGTSTAQLATTAYVMAAVAASTAGVVSFNTRTGVVDLIDTDITNAGGALLASPVFNGTPQAPTATVGTDTAQLATCAFVIAELGGASIGVMTFNGRGGAVVLTGADITGAGGALLAGPAFSGVPTAPTAASGVATQQLATCAFVTSAIAALSIGVSSFNSRTGAVTLTANDVSAAGALVNPSPAMTGAPTAPTASPGVSTTQLATTAFVMAALSAANVVSSFNGRAGVVTLSLADVTGAGGAPLAAPAFTGVPTAATAAPGTSTGQLATTAFVAASGAITTVRSRAFTVGTSTYTPSPGMVYCVIECQAGGGAGGGAAAESGNFQNGGGGGGGGGFSRKTATAAQIGASQTVTVAGYAAGVPYPGAAPNGGNTSVGALCVAIGGSGGSNAPPNSNGVAVSGGGPGTGDILLSGGDGGQGFNNTLGSSSYPITGGAGGNSMWGQGGTAISTGQNGSNGQFGGGGGGASDYAISATNRPGGNGGPGLVVITEYCTH